MISRATSKFFIRQPIRKLEAVIFIVLLALPVTVSQARQDIWEDESLDFTAQTGDGQFNCAGCHSGIENVDTLLMDVPPNVSYDSQSAVVSLSGFNSGNRLSSWRYQIVGGDEVAPVNNVRPADEEGNSSQQIQFKRSDDPIVVRYCLVDADGDDSRRWNCGSETIQRLPEPNEKPVITSANPGDRTLEVGDTFLFAVTASDDDPDPLITVESSKPAVVEISDGASGSYVATAKSVDSALITVRATDSEGLFAEQVFTITVDPVTVVDPPVTVPVDPPVTLPVDPPVTVPVDPPVTLPVDPPVTVPVDPPVTLPVDPPVTVPVDPPVIDLPPVVNVPELPAELGMQVGTSQSYSVALDDESPAQLKVSVQSSDETVVAADYQSERLSVTAKAEGDAKVTLSVTDVLDKVTSVSVNVQVTAANVVPVAVADTFVIGEVGVTVELNVLANDRDADGDALSIVLDSDRTSQGNTIQVSGEVVRYQTDSALTRDDTFSYRAQDTQANQSASVVVTLSPSDFDSDGIVDANDNCPVLPNPEQNDMDSDGEGDLCDVDPDGDGQAGISGAPFSSGQSLVESECLTCHLVGTSGAPVFGQPSVWDARIAAAGGQPEDMLDSVLNGLGAMPSFADKYSTQQLLQAIRYLSGREQDSSVDPVIELSVDLDQDLVADSIDNCPTVPNPDQLDSDDNLTGDLCEPLADKDNDGYPFQLDDDDSNANRLIATLPVVTNATVFTSNNRLELGRVAHALMVADNYASAAVIVPDASFAQGVQQVFPGIEVAEDTGYSSLMGVANIVVSSDAGTADIIMQLSTNLPLYPVMRLFDVDSGGWRDFSQDGGNQVFSAPSTSAGCPAIGSANYKPGLAAGLSCLRVSLTDGGINDAEAASNGQIELMAKFAQSNLDDTSNQPAAVDTNPSKGGGAVHAALLLLLALMKLLFKPCAINRRSR